MKKLFQLPFLAMACVFMSGCTSDYEFEDGQSAKEQKALEVKAKIQELAEDYGLNVKVNADAIEKGGGDVNMDSIETFFRSLASIKGNYALVKLKNGHLVQRPKVKRALKRTSQRESFEFDDESNELFTFYCSVDYDLYNDGTISNVTVYAGIENASAMFKDYWSDVSGTVDAHNTIRISGSVSFTYHEFGYGYVDVKYNVTGYFDGTNGDITWRQQPNWW